MEQQIENLSTALQEAIEFVKKEANLAMANKANRDVVDYYDNFALKLTLVLEENRLAPLEIREAQAYVSRCESDMGFMGSPDYEVKKKLIKDYYAGRQKPLNKLSVLTQEDFEKVRAFPESFVENTKDGNEDYELNKFIQTFSDKKRQIEVARLLNSFAGNLFWNPETHVPQYLGAHDARQYMENVLKKGTHIMKFTKDFISKH